METRRRIVNLGDALALVMWDVADQLGQAMLWVPDQEAGFGKMHGSIAGVSRKHLCLRVAVISKPGRDQTSIRSCGEKNRLCRVMIRTKRITFMMGFRAIRTQREFIIGSKHATRCAHRVVDKAAFAFVRKFANPFHPVRIVRA